MGSSVFHLKARTSDGFTTRRPKLVIGAIKRRFRLMKRARAEAVATGGPLVAVSLRLAMLGPASYTGLEAVWTSVLRLESSSPAEDTVRVTLYG